MKIRTLPAYANLGRLAFFVALAVALFLPYTSLSAAAGTTAVSVSAPSHPIAAGEQFTVNVFVVPNTALSGMQFDFHFNPSLVTIDSVQEGTLLAQGGASTYFNPGQIDNQSGALTGAFGVITTPGQTISTQGTFATIRLTAKTQGGTCTLGLLNVVAASISGDSVLVSLTGDAVTISRPPVLSPIGSRTTHEGETLTFAVSATDPDGDDLTYSAANLPSGASFNPTTRTFSWTPTSDQAGAYSDIRFQVSDGSLTDSESITITVGNVVHPDLNGDGSVNVLDMIRIGQHWNEVGQAGWIEEDVKEDGTVNVLDATLVGQHWTGQ
jgi:hypothetical protein